MRRCFRRGCSWGGVGADGWLSHALTFSRSEGQRLLGESNEGPLELRVGLMFGGCSEG